MIKFFGNRLEENHGNTVIGRGLDVNLSKTEYMTDGINSLNIIAKSMKNFFFNTVNMRQMHTNKAVYVEKFEFLSDIADGIVTKNPELILCIRTADCAPILMMDREKVVIGAVHAGWRGALSGIIANTVNLMVKYGARPENIIAYIGPLLVKESFECKDDMKSEFITADPAFEKFFEDNNVLDPESNTHKKTRMNFDFQKFIEYQLSSSGVHDINYGEIYHERHVWRHPVDTYSSPEYHSYRRAMHQGLQRVGLNCACISLSDFNR